MDGGISEAVHAIVYAAPRVDVQELTIIRDQLIMKYGKDLNDNCNLHPHDHVNPRVLIINQIIHKLSITTPDSLLVTQYLKTIAQAYQVEWDSQLMEEVPKPIGDDFVSPTMPSGNNPTIKVATV